MKLELVDLVDLEFWLQFGRQLVQLEVGMDVATALDLRKARVWHR